MAGIVTDVDPIDAGNVTCVEDDGLSAEDDGNPGYRLVGVT
jgi:hypothetical protein